MLLQQLQQQQCAQIASAEQSLSLLFPPLLPLFLLLCLLCNTVGNGTLGALVQVFMWMQPETNNNNALRSLKSVVRICHDYCNYHVPRPILAKLINSIWRRRRRSAARKHLLLNEASRPPSASLYPFLVCPLSLSLAGLQLTSWLAWPTSCILWAFICCLQIRNCLYAFAVWKFTVGFGTFPFRFHCTPGKLNAFWSGERRQLGNARLKLRR